MQRGFRQETHSAQVELLRHFAGQFFESEFVARPGQMKVLFAGVLSVLLSLCIPFLQAYYHKYLLLKRLEDIEPFRVAVTADMLFLVTLCMLLIGLLTALFWQSLFPDRRDYLALAGLPLRMQEIFRAKFAALVGFVAIASACLAAPPALGLPWMMLPQRGTPHFDAFGGMEGFVPGIFLACFGGAMFVCFALVAMQGVLLNVLPLRASARVSLVVQGAALIGGLAALPGAISISGWTEAIAHPPAWSLWAPPVWFAGIGMVVAGSRDALTQMLAWRGVYGLGGSFAAAILAYWWSYRKHRVRVLESGGDAERTRHMALPELPVAARTLGVFAFTGKTLGRSGRHRMILTGFIGIAGALIAGGGWGVPNQTVALAGSLALGLFVLTGLIYLFRLPVEPGANWLFRVYEPGQAVPLLAGVEWFLLFGGVTPAALLSFTVFAGLFGLAQGAALALVSVPPGLLLAEGLLFAWYKIPFTSLYFPARKPVTETILQFGVGVVLYVSWLSVVLAWSAQSPLRWIPAMGLMTAGYLKVRSMRLEVQSAGRLEFEEVPEAAVQTIDIERD